MLEKRRAPEDDEADASRRRAGADRRCLAARLLDSGAKLPSENTPNYLMKTRQIT